MPKVPIESLQRGDIVLFEWNSGFWHTAIFVGQVGQQQHLIAHSVNEHQGTSTESIAKHHDDAANVYAFRVPVAKANAIEKVMMLVQRWAPIDWRNDPSSTSYGQSRGSGVLKSYDSKNPGNAPPFEYDALFRVFKWLMREEKFSKKQGTTCCAFAMACFQVGLMQQFCEEKGVVDYFLGQILQTLGEGRGAKNHNKPDRQRAQEIFQQEMLEYSRRTGVKKKTQFTDLEFNKIRARREYSNRGSQSAPIPIEELWISLKERAYLEGNETLQDILTSALLSDAKYTYSHTLYEKLRLDNQWRPVN